MCYIAGDSRYRFALAISITADLDNCIIILLYSCAISHGRDLARQYIVEYSIIIYCNDKKTAVPLKHRRISIHVAHVSSALDGTLRPHIDEGTNLFSKQNMSRTRQQKKKIVR